MGRNGSLPLVGHASCLAVRGYGEIEPENVSQVRLSPALLPRGEPLLPLGRGAVGPRLRVDPALGRSLDPIVTDRRRSVEAVADVLPSVRSVISRPRPVAGFGVVVAWLAQTPA